jgi:hypothetical protein
MLRAGPDRSQNASRGRHRRAASGLVFVKIGDIAAGAATLRAAKVPSAPCLAPSLARRSDPAVFSIRCGAAFRIRRGFSLHLHLVERAFSHIQPARAQCKLLGLMGAPIPESRETAGRGVGRLALSLPWSSARRLHDARKGAVAATPGQQPREPSGVVSAWSSTSKKVRTYWWGRCPTRQVGSRAGGNCLPK